MQKAEASVAVAGTPAVIAPAGSPFSVILVHAPLPKQPVDIWSGQKTQSAADLFEVPVVSGDRSTGIVPTKVPSMQLVPGVQGWVASVPPVRQSRVRPWELVVVQSMSLRGPRSHFPVAGLLGLPTAGRLGGVLPVSEHFGQGCPALPVRTT